MAYAKNLSPASFLNAAGLALRKGNILLPFLHIPRNLTKRLRRHNAFFNAKNRRLRSSSTAGQGKQADKEQQGGNSLEFHWKPP